MWEWENGNTSRNGVMKRSSSNALPLVALHLVKTISMYLIASSNDHTSGIHLEISKKISGTLGTQINHVSIEN